MKRRILAVALVTLIPIIAFGRLVQAYNNKALIEKSKLVFVGKVKSIKHSGITTHLSYPTWEGVVFEWLIADVKVLEPVKGVRKGDIVQAALLSVDESKGPRPMINAPGMLEPKVGDAFLFCLAPSSITNVYAAVTAPFDDNLSIFHLNRNDWKPSSFREGLKDEHVALIWSLVDDTGKIIPLGAQKMRKTYAKEIQMAPSNILVYLQWEARTNASGWIANFPKGDRSTNADPKQIFRFSPP
jgi:hypothetical protein